MEEKEISIEESLHIMQNMVKRAKRNISEDGFMFIFWGWLVFLVSLSFYLMITNGVDPGKASIVWATLALGGIYTAIYFIRKNKKEKVRSYIDTYMAYVWIAFAISLVIILNMGDRMQLNCYPVVIMLYAIATFITGGIIQFRPLTICGAISFPISLAAFYVNFENQLLLLDLSLLISYIIPGHWLFRKFRQQQKTTHGV